jgi:hypothetical protein
MSGGRAPPARRWSAGTSVRCPAASELDADDVHVVLDGLLRDSPGVWKSGRCRRRSRGRTRPSRSPSGPRSCPSWPIFATRMRGRGRRPRRRRLDGAPSRPPRRLAPPRLRTRPLIDSGLRLVAAEDLLERERDLADRRARARAPTASLEQVALAGLRAASARERPALDRSAVALGLQALAGARAGPRGRRVVDLQHGTRSSAPTLWTFTPTIFCFPGVDASLRARRCLLDAQLGDPRLDRLDHAAELLDLAHVDAGALRERRG